MFGTFFILYMLIALWMFFDIRQRNVKNAVEIENAMKDVQNHSSDATGKQLTTVIRVISAILWPLTLLIRVTNKK